jgi:hypothetical protein
MWGKEREKHFLFPIQEMGVKTSLFLILLYICVGMKMLYHMIILFLILGDPQTVFHSDCTTLHGGKVKLRIKKHLD